jgi:hypothetical protein
MMSAYFAKVRPTYIENWSAALKALSIPQIDLPLTLEEARALGLINKEFSKWFGNASIESIDKIVKKIDVALGNYPGGAFVRLGSRSSKDSSYAHNRGLRVTDGNAAIRMLTENSRRAAYDLRLALHHNYCPHIFVRQWQEIPAWSEFRCFMKSRKLVGISQYDCKNFGPSSEITKNALRIEASIREFFEVLRVAYHIDDCVFDVFVKLNEQTFNGSAKVQLLELNPFFQKTDACLFHWSDGGDFDESFRFLQFSSGLE